MKQFRLIPPHVAGRTSRVLPPDFRLATCDARDGRARTTTDVGCSDSEPFLIVIFLLILIHRPLMLRLIDGPFFVNAI